jgi:hypothetical protein
MSTFSELIDFTRSSTGTYLGSDGLIKTANVDEPRLEYDASGQPLGLWIEEQRSNLLQQSEAFDNSYWSKENTNVTSDQAVAPDGTNSADKIIEANTTNTFHFVTKSMSLSAGAKTFSAYFKKSERGFAALTLRVDSGAKRLAVIFDLTNGTVADTLTLGSPTQTNSTIENAGNGWYRCSVTAYHSTGNVIALLSPQDDGNGGGNINMDYAGTVGYGVYAWGAQLEQGLFPTSYIPTSGSTVTRNADIPSLPIERFSYNDTQGTLFAEFEHNAVNSSASFLVSDNTLNNRIQLTSRQTGTSGATAFISASGTTQTAFSTSYNFIAGNKSTLAYKLNDCATTMNGYSVNADTSVTIPTVTTVYIGNINSGAKINGHVKRIQYFPKRLSNDELVELTKPSSSPTMSLTFDGQATSELVEGLHD